MWAVQREVPETVDFLWQLQQEWPGAPIVVETQGGEGRSIAQMLRRMNQHLNIVEVTCGADKFTRAQPASAAWNGGRIRVPQREYDPKSKLVPVGSHPAWIAQMLDELQRFTGVGDRHDDQVDALVHLYNFADSQADVRSVRLGAKRQYQRAGY
jgi:phage terminase large subunit-like protein